MEQQLQLMDLPTEVLQEIFSNIPVKDLYYRVGRVCKRFNAIAMHAGRWESIEVDSEVPTRTLQSWIRSANRLKRFRARSRKDLNFIIEEVWRSCKKLESMELVRCWGSRRDHFIHSGPLCNLITGCANLRRFRLTQCRLRSCKLLKLLARFHRRGCKQIGHRTVNAFFANPSEHDGDAARNTNLSHQVTLSDVLR